MSDDLSPEMMTMIGRHFARRLRGKSVGSRIGVAVSMINAALDEHPSIRGDLLHCVIETLKADHVQETVEL